MLRSIVLRLYDAHNHLQDERLTPFRSSILTTIQAEPIVRMVVNGSSEQDWPQVADLARVCPQVVPSFGYHPWYVKERSPDWERNLIGALDQLPSSVGEIGLDRWIKDYDFPLQEEMFSRQLRIAAERNLPVSIHCLQAWGRLIEILHQEPRPACGFLLHSFGGARELIPELVGLGAYFSLPGYFAHERKVRQRESFQHVPIERLLIETDAPDQLLPDSRIAFPLIEQGSGKQINHPANLRQVYQFAAELLELDLETLATQVEANFLRLFGGLLTP